MYCTILKSWLILDKNVVSHGLIDVSLDVSIVVDVVAQKSTLLTTILTILDVDVALEYNVVFFSGAYS